MVESLVGKWVGYYGSDSQYYGGEYEIIDQGIENSRRVKINFPGGAEWKTLGNCFSEPFNVPAAPVENKFLNPNSEAISTIDNEIKRLQNRIEELKTAKKVLKSL